MKVPVIIYTAAAVFLLNIQDEKASAQVVAPSFYGGAPLMYGYEDNDDDFGVLLALLLLASRNRGGNGYGGNGYCCNSCNNVRTVPVPFPIPFPTNNPIIRQSVTDNDESSNSSPLASITIKTENNEETTNDTNINDALTNNSSSNSTATSNANSTSPASNSNAAATQTTHLEKSQ